MLATCSFDLKFTYILPGWEGIASDSRIIKSVLTRNDNLKIPQGKFNSNIYYGVFFIIKKFVVYN